MPDLLRASVPPAHHLKNKKMDQILQTLDAVNIREVHNNLPSIFRMVSFW